MKHTEQLQPRSPGNPRTNTLTVKDQEVKPNTGRKCCGGGDSSDDKN